MSQLHQLARRTGIAISVLFLVMFSLQGCSPYVPPSGSNIKPSNIALDVTLDETQDTLAPFVTYDLEFSLVVGSISAVDFGSNGKVTCDGQTLTFSLGLYRLTATSFPNQYTCIYDDIQDSQTASFSIQREPAPAVPYPNDAATFPANSSVTITYQPITPPADEIGIAVLDTLPTTAVSDSAFRAESSSLTFQTGPSGTSGLISITRRFKDSPQNTGLHSVAVLYDVSTSLAVTNH